jgi:hypothetical protein
MTAFPDLDRQMLAFERRFWRYAGAKDQAIVDEFGCSPTIYYQRLRHLTHRPEAQAHDPQTVNRLLRLEQQRRARRAG